MQISFVIVTRDRTEYLLNCLRSIQRVSLIPSEVIIVDNAELDTTESEIRKCVVDFTNLEIHYFRVLPDERILSAGRNFGAKQASGEIVAFIDDDVELHEGWIQACLEGFSNKNVVAVGGRIIEPDDKDKDPFENLPIGKLLPNGKTTANFYLDPKKIIEIDHIRGCNWALKRDVFLELGGFSGALRHVFEETELCFRIAAAGKVILFNPKMAVDHHCGPRVHLLRKRDPALAALQQRETIAAYTELLLSGFGIFSSYTLRFLVCSDTGAMGIFRTPNFDTLKEVINLWRGKFLGVIRFYSVSKSSLRNVEILRSFSNRAEA